MADCGGMKGGVSPSVHERNDSSVVDDFLGEAFSLIRWWIWSGYIGRITSPKIFMEKVVVSHTKRFTLCDMQQKQPATQPNERQVMSVTETPVATPVSRKPRATTQEMADRKQAAIDVAKNSPAPVTLEQIREALNLNPPTAVALVRALLDDGSLVLAGKNGRRLLLRPGKGGKARAVAATPAAAAPAPARRAAPTTRKGDLNVNDLLASLHIGADYEMVGFQVKKDKGITIDLQEKSVPGGRVLTVALAGAA